MADCAVSVRKQDKKKGKKIEDVEFILLFRD